MNFKFSLNKLAGIIAMIHHIMLNIIIGRNCANILHFKINQ